LARQLDWWLPSQNSLPQAIFCLPLNLLWWLTWVDGAMESGSSPCNGTDLYFILNNNNYHLYYPCSIPSLCPTTSWRKKIWTLNNNGLFSVKSCSKMLDQLLYGGAKPFQSSVWIKLTPSKVQLFLWLVVQDKVTTRDFLFQHDYLTLQESRCAFCNKSLESSSHLFIHCHFTWNI